MLPCPKLSRLREEISRASISSPGTGIHWTRVRHANTDRRTSSPRVILVASAGGVVIFILSSNHDKADITTHNHLAQQTFIQHLWEIAAISKNSSLIVPLQDELQKRSNSMKVYNQDSHHFFFFMRTKRLSKV